MSAGVCPARVLAFMCCMAMFALNEVARELEVPFHVAHNDINIEELHDEFLSMLETVSRHEYRCHLGCILLKTAAISLRTAAHQL